MKVLIACEESQTVCKAFRARGHEAFSCDILPCSGGHPEWHIQGSIISVLEFGAHFTQDKHPVRSDVEWKMITEWDLMIAHPPCTYLCNSGVRWLYNEDGTINQDRWDELVKGAEFFKKLLYAPIPRIAIENPIMHKYAREAVGVNYGQCIQPYEFGNPNTKATGIWLKNVPALKIDPEKLVPKEDRIDTIHKMGPSDHRGKDRSVTFPEFADAMAEQWGDL